ncbi:hypothetical protein QOT17_004829 [Balamuthia mandrillaris]
MEALRGCVTSITEAIEEVADEEREAGSPEERTIEVSKELSSDLLAFITSLETSAKKDMIVGTRKISTTLTNLVDAANGMSAKNKDRGNQEKIISAAVKARKTGVNLKILTAMAAAGTDAGKETTQNMERIENAVEELCESVVKLIELTNVGQLEWVTV